jgi:hypothetical protein
MLAHRALALACVAALAAWILATPARAQAVRPCGGLPPTRDNFCGYRAGRELPHQWFTAGGEAELRLLGGHSAARDYRVGYYPAERPEEAVYLLEYAGAFDPPTCLQPPPVARFSPRGEFGLVHAYDHRGPKAVYTEDGRNEPPRGFRAYEALDDAGRTVGVLLLVEDWVDQDYDDLGLLLLGAKPVRSLERFSYCGTMQVREGASVPLIPVRIPPGSYVGPTGVTTAPPRTCVYVILGEPRGGRYHPTLVVWSDVPSPAYHADIYSDPEGIFGHRQQEPSGQDLPRIREMESYLDAAAGVPVLLAVLDSLRKGRSTATLDRVVKVPVPAGGGMGFELPVRYQLTEIRANPTFPPHVLRLMEQGRARRAPHSPEWQPITIPVERVPG